MKKIANSSQYIVDGKRIGIFLFACLLFTIYCLLPTSVFAQDQTTYTLLEPLPTVSGGGETTTASQYISGIFTLAIGVAGVLAVLMIIFGGIKYMSTDAFSGKEEAKGTINNAIWGLALAMGAWMILNTINPDLVGFDLRLERQEIQAPSGGTGGGGGLTPSGTGPGHLQLTQEQVMTQFNNAGIQVAGAIQLTGLRQMVVDEVVALRQDCGGCAVVVTSATGGQHASGTCSHSNGYKLDLRRVNEGVPLTSFITSNYERLPDRSDGAQMYRSIRGGLYALEGSHLDVVRC